MQSREVPFSEFVKNVTGGEIRAVTLDGEKVRFISSKSPFNMNSTLEKNMDIMLNQYKKHRSQGLNIHAKPFVPSFQ